MFEHGKLFIFYTKYLFRDWSNGASFIMYFSILNEYLSFSSSFMVNPEPSEQNFNSIFVN